MIQKPSADSLKYSCTYQLDSDSASIAFVEQRESSLLVRGSLLHRHGVLRVSISCWPFEAVSADELLLVALSADQTATYQYAPARPAYEFVHINPDGHNGCRSPGTLLFWLLCACALGALCGWLRVHTRSAWQRNVQAVDKTAHEMARTDGTALV